ncbi:MFS transporter [Glycomyces sp. NPDC048151]|uniref:MFS transporter n=1 Tax=Glycomyces sp. NPDC048151 TaxID=3364002 RepID=UPI00371DA2DF
MRSNSPDARRRFIAASLVDAVGNGIYVPLTMLFVHALTGQSLTAVGTGLTLAGIGALAAVPAVGVLIDRHGGKHVYTGALALRAIAFALYPLATSYPAFLGVALTVAVAMWASAPSQQALIGDMAEGADRDRLLAWNRSLRNGGMGFGALAAAAMLAVGDGGYLASALALAGAFAVAAVLVALMPVTAKTPKAIERPASGYRTVLADRRYRRLTAANFLIAFGYSAQAIALPVFLTRDADLPDALAGVVFAVNTALVAGLGVPVGRLMARFRRGSGAALGTAVFAVSFAAFAFLPALDGTAAVVAVLATAVLYTAGELIHSAPSESLAVHAAPDHLRGRYLSFYQLSWSLCRTLAPMLLGLLLDAGTWQLWAALSASVLIGGAMLLRADRAPVRPAPESVLAA